MKKLPVGIENFEDFFTEDFYYIDKTMFIAELLQNWGKVNLFTRPRRFGKTLTVSMLKTFFEIGCNTKLFAGLKISQETELCEKYMGRFPVISLTLKSVDGCNYQGAIDALRSVIGTEAMRFQFLEESDRLTENERNRYRALANVNSDGDFTMKESVMLTSLKTLSQLLSKHYGKKVILLIDEYDVPLDKAFQAGYYDEMILLIRNLFGNVLKTNDSLYFAVLTGCLRISKESIFTGLNNLKVHTATDARYDEYFGFTDSEVRGILEFYGLADHGDVIRDWYDGYQFGRISVYCPWDVMNYCDALLADPDTEPENYWANTSGNSMVRRFIDKADQSTRDEIEYLIEGGSVVKDVKQDLTYKELDESIDHLWSVLLTTGYLTARERISAGRYRLAIPNMEIRELFISQVREWFRESVKRKPGDLKVFCDAVIDGKSGVIQEMLTEYLKRTISIRDSGTKSGRRESFYHGMLLGLLSYPADWSVKSNMESGEGYCDILIRDHSEDTGVVIEVKYAEKGNFDAACREALRQIETRDYEAVFMDEGMKRTVKYGIAFYKKRCMVMVAQNI